jgi:hypothetical protein
MSPSIDTIPLPPAAAPKNSPVGKYTFMIPLTSHWVYKMLFLPNAEAFDTETNTDAKIHTMIRQKIFLIIWPSSPSVWDEYYSLSYPFFTSNFGISPPFQSRSNPALLIVFPSSLSFFV